MGRCAGKDDVRRRPSEPPPGAFSPETPRRYDSRVMTDSVSMNPFQPGAGLLPGYMGHRPAIERPLVDIVDRLRSGQKGPRLAYLYGPRGNGKTVLLQWLADQVEKKGGAHPIVQVRLLPEHLTSSEMLVQRIRSAVRRTPGVFDNLTVNLEAGIPGVSLKVGSEARDDPMLGLSDWLEQDRYPVLFSLDEAHEADPVVLGRLLNAVQLAGQDRPVGAILAGTPGLLDTLAGSRASFWSRGEKLAVGLLPDGEARAVLARPFLDAGLEASADSICELARAADDYPYFLQLYGAAAWDAVKATGASEIGLEHVTAAIDATSVPRRKYYRERYEEFRKANALPLARDVALAFTEADRPMTDVRLDKLLARHAEDPAEMRALLNAKGFVWQDDDDHWTPGIPSLMGYMIGRTEPEHESNRDWPDADRDGAGGRGA